MDIDDSENDDEVRMTVMDDGHTIVLTFISSTPFTRRSFLVEMESYIHEYSRAVDLADDPALTWH